MLFYRKTIRKPAMFHGKFYSLKGKNDKVFCVFTINKSQYKWAQIRRFVNKLRKELCQEKACVRLVKSFVHIQINTCLLFWHSSSSLYIPPHFSTTFARLGEEASPPPPPSASYTYVLTLFSIVHKALK